MHTLPDIQQGFAAAIFDEAGWEGFAAHLRSNGLDGARRLQVYRNNVFESLTEALRAVYPVIERLTGEGFFRYCADRYIRRYPSESGNLHDFGRHFAHFLAQFPPAAELVYLPDVARLEWAYHAVFHGPDHGPLDLAALCEVKPEHYDALCFKLHPASRLLASDYPLLHIWQMNQNEAPEGETVRLAEGGVHLLIIRPGLEVELRALPAGEFALLEALDAGRTLAAAYERACALEPDIDLRSCLLRHIVQHSLVGFSL